MSWAAWRAVLWKSSDAGETQEVSTQESLKLLGLKIATCRHNSAHLCFLESGGLRQEDDNLGPSIGKLVI